MDEKKRCSKLRRWYGLEGFRGSERQQQVPPSSNNGDGGEIEIGQPGGGIRWGFLGEKSARSRAIYRRKAWSRGQEIGANRRYFRSV
jgi:hypothetical protein